MQQTMTLRPDRFTAPLVILSLAAGFVMTFTLASIPVAQMPVSPDQWWMWCWIGFGGWYGLTIQFIRTPIVRFIPLPLVGGAAFGVAQIMTVLFFDNTTIALPYYLASILPAALFGGIGMVLFSYFIKERTRIISFLLLGFISFGVGQAFDYVIRNVILPPHVDQFNNLIITSFKLIACICFGLCVGVGSFIALKQH